MMKKLLLLLFLSISYSSITEAAESTAKDLKSLLLTKHDGTEIVLMFDQIPVISFDQNMQDCAAYNMTVRTVGSTITIPTSEVMSVIPSDLEVSDITEILSPGGEGDTSLDYLDGALLIDASHDGIILEVYNIAGVRQLYRVLPQGKSVLRLDALPKDFYIVKVGNQTLKIQKS